MGLNLFVIANQMFINVDVFWYPLKHTNYYNLVTMEMYLGREIKRHGHGQEKY